MKVEKKLKKNKSVERKNLLQFHFVLNQLKFHVVQLVQEADHDVEEVVFDQIVMNSRDVNFSNKYFLKLNQLLRLATSPSQGQQSPSTQQYDDQQNSYRGGQRGGRGEYRRPNRGSRQGRSNADPNAPSLDNPDDFPTLPKQ
jgi:hypothetical protein